MNRSSLSAGPAIAALLLLLQACGGDSSSAGPDGVTVTDSAGVRIVENSGDGTWTDGEAWTAEEVFRVGGIDAETDAMFGQIVSVDVDDEGRVYVADQQARQVSVFSDDGTLLRTVGQPGSGPGEIGQMFMGMFERDGEVWTIDLGGQGVQRFGLEGEFLGNTPVNVMSGIPIRMDEIESGVLAQRRAMGADGAMGATGDAVTTIGAETTDTITVLPIGQTVTMSGGEAQMVMLAPEPIWDVADDGSWVEGMQQQYRFEVYDADGRLDRVVIRDVEPQPVTEGVERVIRRALRDQMQAMGAPAEAMEPMLQQMQFADTMPMVAQLLLEGDGHLWVQKTGDIAELADDENFDLQSLGLPMWDIFDAEGVYLGQLALPQRFQPLRLIDGVLWGIELDDLDVQSVVGMRVVR